MEINSGLEKWRSRYLGHNHDQFHANFMTNFIPWPGHDLGQVHYLENYMTSARVMTFDKVMTLVKYRVFVLNFAKIMALAMTMALAMAWPWQ